VTVGAVAEKRPVEAKPECDLLYDESFGTSDSGNAVSRVEPGQEFEN
jgi:hypothetical protein